MNKFVLIEIEINGIKASIDRIKKLCDSRPQAYSIKHIIEKYLFQKLFFKYKK